MTAPDTTAPPVDGPEPDPFPAEAADTPPAPFEGALTFPIEKKVNLTQLTDEISAAVGRQVSLALSGDASYNSLLDPSPDNPATLSVSPGNVDEAKVQTAIDDHDPDDHYGVPQVEQEFGVVMQKIAEDASAELSPDEVVAAVRGLLLRAAAMSGPAPSGNPRNAGQGGVPLI